jgi:LysM repeat protein
MASTDLSSLTKPRPLIRVPFSYFRRQVLRVSAALVFSSIFLGTACQAQDVAAAARQSHREAEAKKEKHVYTEEDLRRPHILTPEDRARVEAKRKQETSPAKPKSTEPLDANADGAQLPLGDVARRFRKEKQARQVRPAAPFHLPFSEPAFASPVLPAHPRLVPARPGVFGRPSAPLVMIPNGTPRRPSEVVPAPNLKSAPIRRVDPFAKRFTPSAPAPIMRAPKLPAVTAPNASSSARAVPLADARGLRAVTVQPGDSLWKLAERNLGRASRWRELMAVNPDIVDADYVVAGTRIYLPAKAPAALRAAKTRVQPGDTLSKIALSQYGRLEAWRCLAQANPQIADANRIFVGQELSLPSSCKP